MYLQSSFPFFVLDLLIQESYSSSAFAFLHIGELGFKLQMHAFFAIAFLASFSQSSNCSCGLACLGAGGAFGAAFGGGGDAREPESSGADQDS